MKNSINTNVHTWVTIEATITRAAITTPKNNPAADLLQSTENLVRLLFLIVSVRLFLFQERRFLPSPRF